MCDRLAQGCCPKAQWVLGVEPDDRKSSQWLDHYTTESDIHTPQEEEFFKGSTAPHTHRGGVEPQEIHVLHCGAL